MIVAINTEHRFKGISGGDGTMFLTLFVTGLERLAKLSSSEQAFLIQMGLLVVAVLALWVALKANSRRGR